MTTPIEIHVHSTINVFGPFGQDGISQILDQLRDLKQLVTVLGAGELELAQQEMKMTKATDDLNAVVQALGDTVNNTVVPGLTSVGAAIDALVAAQGEDDSDAIEAQVAVLQGLVPGLTGAVTALQGHLPTVASAATAAAQAPADPTANIVAPTPSA